jgi:hypothetical protein
MFCISISGRFAAGLPYIYPTNGRGNYTPLFNQPIDSRTSVGNPIATAGSVRVNLNRSFQDQQSTPNWTPSQVGVSLPSAAQSNFTEITFGIPRGIPQPGFQAFSGNQRLAAYRARYGVPQFAPPLLPSALPAQAPRLPTAEGTSARQPIGAWLQDAAQSQVAPALGQHPVLFQLPPAGPHDSTAVSSTSSESNPDDRLDGVSGVENLAEVLGGAENKDGDEDNINEEDKADALEDDDLADDETEELSTVSPDASLRPIVPHQLQTPRAATVETFVFEGQFNSPLPLQRLGMTTNDFEQGAFFLP